MKMDYGPSSSLKECVTLVNDELMVGQWGITITLLQVQRTMIFCLVSPPRSTSSVEMTTLLNYMYFQKIKQTFVHCSKVEIHLSRTVPIFTWLIWNWSRTKLVFFCRLGMHTPWPTHQALLAAVKQSWTNIKRRVFFLDQIFIPSLCNTVVSRVR